MPKKRKRKRKRKRRGEGRLKRGLIQDILKNKRKGDFLLCLKKKNSSFQADQPATNSPLRREHKAIEEACWMTGSERFTRMKSQGEGGPVRGVVPKASRLELIPKHEAPGQELGGAQV